MTKTYHEQFDEALACTTREEADAWLEREAAELVLEYPGTSVRRAGEIIKSNLGYMSGYYGIPEAEHVYALFDAEHPVFGTPAMRRKTTLEDAYAAGVQWAEYLRERERP